MCLDTQVKRRAELSTHHLMTRLSCGEGSWIELADPNIQGLDTDHFPIARILGTTPLVESRSSPDEGVSK